MKKEKKSDLQAIPHQKKSNILPSPVIYVDSSGGKGLRRGLLELLLGGRGDDDRLWGWFLGLGLGSLGWRGRQELLLDWGGQLG